MTKHLALLASLGKLGLSEHIVVVESVVDLRGARQGRRTESRVLEQSVDLRGARQGRRTESRVCWSSQLLDVKPLRPMLQALFHPSNPLLPREQGTLDTGATFNYQRA